MPKLIDPPVVEPDAITDYEVDLTTAIPDGATVASAVWGLTRRFTLPGYTRDNNPTAHISNASTLTGAITTQRVENLMDGNDYLITITGTMDDGQVVPLWTHLSCRSPH